MNYKELAQKIVDELSRAQEDGIIYKYTMYYWFEEATEELARILEKIMEKEQEYENT